MLKEQQERDNDDHTSETFDKYFILFTLIIPTVPGVEGRKGGGGRNAYPLLRGQEARAWPLNLRGQKDTSRGDAKDVTFKGASSWKGCWLFFLEKGKRDKGGKKVLKEGRKREKK